MKTAQKEIESLGIKKLSKTEMKFMDVIWAHPQGITSAELYSRFSQALGTKSTILHRITGKGMVTVVRSSKHYIYIPRITKKEYIKVFFREKLKREFGITAFEDMVAGYCGREELAPDEKARIKQLLQELGGEE